MKRLLHLFFFASGATALIYQVAWVSILKVDFGTTVHAVSTALTIFMAGLALGSAWVGRIVDRGARPLAVYAALEAALGVWSALFALSVPAWHALSARLLSGTTLSVGSSAPIQLLLAAAVLLPPAVCMGGTLPALAKAITESPAVRGARLARLYGINTLGAVAGCVLEAFVLVPTVGVRASILLAAAINLGLGAAAFALARRAPAAETAAAPAAGMAAAPTERAPVALALTLAFLSGFLTLAAEVLWTRLAINLLTANVLVFAALLAGFLTGLGAGALLVARRADRLPRPDRTLARWLLAAALCLVASIVAERGLGHLFDAVLRARFEWAPARTLLALALLALVVAVPATIFGAVLPLLFRWGAGALATLGTDVGRLYAWNTLGGIAGSLLAGFVLIEHLGVRAGLLVLAAGYVVMAALVSRPAAPRAAGVLVAATAVLLGGLLLPAVRTPLFWLNGGFMGVSEVSPAGTAFLAEDLEGTVGVLRYKGTLGLAVNGVIVAQDTRADLWDLLLKAHLPLLLHESPRTVALVGLGAGVSAGATLAHDVERVDCAEIAAQVVPAHQLFAAVNGRCWEDPRLAVIVNDGRHVLATTTERYDVISVDPTDPPVVYQYSRDFFAVCRERLNPGGLMVQWLPLFHLSSAHLRIVMQAFAQVFPETTVWYDGTSVLLIGSRDRPLAVDAARLRARLARPSVRANLAPIGGPDAELLLATYVCGPEGLRRMIGAGVPENSDDRPYLESTILMSGPLLDASLADNLQLLLDEWETTGAPPSTRRELMRDLLAARIERLREGDARLAERARAMIDTYRLTPQQWESLDVFLM